MNEKDKKILDILEFIFNGFRNVENEMIELDGDFILPDDQDKKKVDYPTFKMLNDAFWNLPVVKSKWLGAEGIVVDEDSNGYVVLWQTGEESWVDAENVELLSAGGRSLEDITENNS